MIIATEHIREGSTSTGSCRLDHIIDGIRYLAEYDQELSDLIYEFGDQRDMRLPIYEEIVNRLNVIAPDGLAFGPRGYGIGNYGFWRTEA